MPQLSKQDIKEIFTETLEPFAKSTQQDFQKVNSRLDGIDGRLSGVEDRLINVEQDVKWMKDNFGELFAKLDKFI
jgi:predicted nuclease with TOPRIM domain